MVLGYGAMWECTWQRKFFFVGKFSLSDNDEKWSKMTQKWEFSFILKNFGIDFCWNLNENIYSLQITYLAKLLDNFMDQNAFYQSD